MSANYESLYHCCIIYREWRQLSAPACLRRWWHDQTKRVPTTLNLITRTLLLFITCYSWLSLDTSYRFHRSNLDWKSRLHAFGSTMFGRTDFNHKMMFWSLLGQGWRTRHILIAIKVTNLEYSTYYCRPFMLSLVLSYIGLKCPIFNKTLYTNKLLIIS